MTAEKMSPPCAETHLCCVLFSFTAHISGMNVAASRSFEPMRGIEVMDKEGNVIGYSRKAGTKVGGHDRVVAACLLGKEFSV